MEAAGMKVCARFHFVASAVAEVKLFFKYTRKW